MKILQRVSDIVTYPIMVAFRLLSIVCLIPFAIVAIAADDPDNDRTEVVSDMKKLFMYAFKP